MNVFCIHLRLLHQTLGFKWFQVLCKFWELSGWQLNPYPRNCFYPQKFFFVQLHECYSCTCIWLFSQTSRTDISIVLELFPCIYLSQILATPAFLKVSRSPINKTAGLLEFPFPVPWFENVFRHRTRAIVPLTSCAYLLSKITFLHCV